VKACNEIFANIAEKKSLATRFLLYPASRVNAIQRAVACGATWPILKKISLIEDSYALYVLKVYNPATG
jgi:hypothetical protein